MPLTEEKQIENMLIDFLRARGHFVWANENTPTYDPKIRGFRKFNTKYKYRGAADILGISRHGRFIAIEVKKPEVYALIERHIDKWLGFGLGRYKEGSTIYKRLEQNEFLTSINKKGGIGIFASDSGHLLAAGL